MKKEKFIKNKLLKNIKYSNKEIDKYYKEIKKIRKLPNDCLGVLIDGLKCENKDYKIDLLTNHYHVIGYLECLKTMSKELLELNNMNKTDFCEYLKSQKEFKKHNKKEFKKLKKSIK